MKLLNALMLSCLFLFLSCQKDQVEIELPTTTEYSHRVPLLWNQLYLEVERYTPGYKPPVSARNIGYINLAAYEAIVNGSGFSYRSLVPYYDGLDIDKPEEDIRYDWEVCMHAAYERSFELFFPVAPAAQQFKILDVSSALTERMQLHVDPVVYQRSVRYGQYVAQTVYDWSMDDEWGHEGYLKNTDAQYFPPSADGLWTPTYPDYLPALLPHWGKVRTFAALGDDVSDAPPTFSTDSSSQIFIEAMETYTLVNEIKDGGRDEDFWIAQFWSDDCPILTFSPAGRWISITNQVIATKHLDLMDAAAAYAKVSMALADAGIKCWQGKYDFNLMRPIDYIRKHMGEPSWNTIMCPDGSGGFYTPPFPTYPSGHATFGGAASEVLSGIFGSAYRFTDRSHEGRTEFRGEPRSFNSFHEAALENAYSRVPLGVHFQMDSDAGMSLGIKIGSRVNSLPWK